MHAGNYRKTYTDPRITVAKATLPSSWQRMGKIEFAIVDSASGAALTALFLDNVAYQVYECT